MPLPSCTSVVLLLERKARTAMLDVVPAHARSGLDQLDYGFGIIRTQLPWGSKDNEQLRSAATTMVLDHLGG